MVDIDIDKEQHRSTRPLQLTGRWQYEGIMSLALRSVKSIVDFLKGRINLPLFSTVVPAITFVFLSCRLFVAITTLSTGLVGVEVTSISWLGQLEFKSLIIVIVSI